MPLPVLIVVVLFVALLVFLAIGGGPKRSEESDPARSQGRRAESSSEQKGAEGERLVRAVVENMGLEAVHDHYVMLSHGTTSQMDHIVKAGRHIIVLETKNWSARKIELSNPANPHDDWIVHYAKGKTYPEHSPVAQNDQHWKIIRDRFYEKHRDYGAPARVESLVVMVETMPDVDMDEVVHITELRDKLDFLAQQSGRSEKAEMMWQWITSEDDKQVFDKPQLREAHRRRLEAKCRRSHKSGRRAA